MNSRPDFAEIANEAATQHLLKTWFIVSQVKSHRVVYFTDDPDYTPPTEGDWYYVSPYPGELPKAMSLRNCWGWRFNGMEFSDAREGRKPDAAQTLLAGNKEALHKLLRDKIDLLRKPLVPGSVMGHTLRALRLEEARAVLGGKPHEVQNWKLLPTSAAARGISLQAMARRTVDAHDIDYLAVEGASGFSRQEGWIKSGSRKFAITVEKLNESRRSSQIPLNEFALIIELPQAMSDRIIANDQARGTNLKAMAQEAMKPGTTPKH